MLKEIHHKLNQKDCEVLNTVTKEIFETQKSIEKTKQTILEIYSNKKNADLLCSSSYKYIEEQIVKLNSLRKKFFNDNEFLPQEFHYGLALKNNNIEIIEDSVTFKNIRYTINQENLKKICDINAMAVLPYSVLKDSINIEEDLVNEIKYKSDIFVLVDAKNINLNNCLSASEKDLAHSIVPSVLETKWESFVFQTPVYKEIYQKIDNVDKKINVLSNSFVKMNEMIKTIIEKQEQFNKNVNENLNKVFELANKSGLDLHYKNELHKDKIYKVPDYKNPTYEMEKVGVDPYENDWGYTNYRSYYVVYKPVYPMIDLLVKGFNYKRIYQDERISPFLMNLFKDFNESSFEEKMNLIDKAKNCAYMILKKEGEEFKVITKMRGVEAPMALLLNQTILETN